MDGFTELALMFKERDNKTWSGINIGTIISLNPLEIRLNESVILNFNHLILSNTFNTVRKEVDDQVILIPTSDEQKYYVVDKIAVL